MSSRAILPRRREFPHLAVCETKLDVVYIYRSMGIARLKACKIFYLVQMDTLLPPAKNARLFP